MATAADLLQSATGVPRSDALLLLAKLLGVAKERLIAHPETVVSEKTQATFFDWIERVRGGFPTTYLLGTQSFWGRDSLKPFFILSIPKSPSQFLTSEPEAAPLP